MQFYSHLVVSTLLQDSLDPVDSSQYFLGTIIPDIRYYNKLPREKTHLSMKELDVYAESMPHLESFIMGYRLHCLIDEHEAELFDQIRQTYPIRLVEKRLTAFMLKMMIEFYYFENYRLTLQLDDTQNEMLIDLGVTTNDVNTYIEALNEFLSKQTFEAGLEAFEQLGIMGAGNVDKYVAAAHQIKRMQFLKAPIRWMLRGSLDLFQSKMMQEIRK